MDLDRLRRGIRDATPRICLVLEVDGVIGPLETRRREAPDPGSAVVGLPASELDPAAVWISTRESVCVVTRAREPEFEG